jgi:hypothetical protein
MAIISDIRGRVFGHLVTEFRDTARPHRVMCRCSCERLVSVAVDDLGAGLIDSCGCAPPSAAVRAQQAELRQEIARKAMFQAAMPNVRKGR